MHIKKTSDNYYSDVVRFHSVKEYVTQLFVPDMATTLRLILPLLKIMGEISIINPDASLNYLLSP